MIERSIYVNERANNLITYDMLKEVIKTEN